MGSNSKKRRHFGVFWFFYFYFSPAFVSLPLDALYYDYHRVEIRRCRAPLMPFLFDVPRLLLFRRDCVLGTSDKVTREREKTIMDRFYFVPFPIACLSVDV